MDRCVEGWEEGKKSEKTRRKLDSTTKWVLLHKKIPCDLFWLISSLRIKILTDASIFSCYQRLTDCSVSSAPDHKLILLLSSALLSSPPLVQFERDVMIWNNKTYISKPLLVKEDSAIQKHRRWFSQFYSKNSPRLQYQRDTLDFWPGPSHSRRRWCRVRAHFNPRKMNTPDGRL